MVNLLVITTLFPNKMQPRHGIFVETRVRKLTEGGKFRATVIAPVPWFPFKTWFQTRYSVYANVPKEERRGEMNVYHPRYLVIPKIGFVVTPVFLALSIFLCIRRQAKLGLNFDLIDAHYYYPDGVSAALVARLFKKPLTITARGSDINILPNFRIPKKWMQWASTVASKNISVSEALKLRMLELGFQADKLFVSANGVDLNLYQPIQRAETALKGGGCPDLLLSAGNLVELKGHDLVIKAMVQLPAYHLCIAGAGELETELKALATELCVSDRVDFVGAVLPEDMVELYNRAKFFVLASANEGMPNVLLESMACGTPVVATAVGGVPEIIRSNEAGVLVKEREVEEIVAAIKFMASLDGNRQETRNYARKFSWDTTIPSLENLLLSVLPYPGQAAVEQEK